MADVVGELAVKVSADTAQMGKEIGRKSTAAGQDSAKRFGSAFSSQIKTLAIGAGLAIGAQQVVQFVGSTITAASDLGESVNAVNVVFGKFGDDTVATLNRVSQESAKTYGLTTTDFNSMAVQFSSFAGTVAGEGGDVAQTIQDLTGRSADFASVMNLEVADAARIFQSGLAGETEPLKKFGIDLSQAAVEAYALAEGIHDGEGAMTEAEKVQARYGLLMQSTADTAGDFANTSDSLANRQRVLSAEWTNTKATLGQALVPAMESLLGVAQSLLPHIEGLFTGVGKAVENFKQWAPWIGLAAAAIAGLYAQTIAANAVLLVARGIYGAIRLATLAWQAAQWLLNAALLANPVGLIVAGIILLIGAVIYAWNNFDWFREAVVAAWEAIKGAALAVVDWFTGTLVPVLETVWEAIKTGLEAVWNVVKFVVGLWLAIWTVLIKALWAAMQWVWGKIQPFVSAALDGILAVVRFFVNGALAIWDGLKAIWTFIRDTFSKVWSTVSDWLGRIWDKIVGWVDGILQPFRDLKSKLVEAGKDFIRGIWDGIKSMGRWLYDKVAGFISDNLPGPIKSALGIASPSKVAAALGGEVAAGLVVGLEGGTRDVAGAAGSLAAAAAPRSPSWAAPSGGYGGGLSVRVFIGDEELRGMVRTEMDDRRRTDTVALGMSAGGGY